MEGEAKHISRSDEVGGIHRTLRVTGEANSGTTVHYSQRTHRYPRQERKPAGHVGHQEMGGVKVENGRCKNRKWAVG